MDSSAYKTLKQKWNVKSRKVITDSMSLIEHINPEMYVKLAEALSSPPVPKPPKHDGGKETDFYEVKISEEEAQELIDTLFELEAAAVPQGVGLGFEKEAIQAREASRIASLVDEWNKLNAE